MNVVPKYDLLPLMWWENPWNIGLIVVAVLLVLAAIFAIVWFVKVRKNKPLHPIEKSLFDLHVAQHKLHSGQCTLQHGYDEMMRVIREYAHEYYMSRNISNTDEEFVRNLKEAASVVPQQFLMLVEQVTTDAYQVKFANTFFSCSKE